LLTGLAHTIDKLDLIPGKDYTILTISFKHKRRLHNGGGENKIIILRTMKIKTLAEGDWEISDG